MSPLLLLHGFTGAPAVWDAVVERLPEGPARVPALGGHGGAWTSWDEEVDRLLTLVADLEDVHVVGYSMGGRLAYGLLARRSPRITRATLIGAHPGLEDDDARAARRDADGEWIARLDQGLPAFVEAWSALPMWASQARVPAEARQRRTAIRLDHDPAGLAHALRAYGLAAMPPAQPERIDIPVTLAVGELDETHRELASGIVSRFGNARVAVVPDSGHDVTLEAPDALARLICATEETTL